MTTATATDSVEAARPAIAVELTRGAVGGVLAGAAFLFLNMWYATSTDMPAKMPILMMSTIAQGDNPMMDGSASVSIGLVVHAVLSIPPRNQRGRSGRIAHTVGRSGLWATSQAWPSRSVK